MEQGLIRRKEEVFLACKLINSTIEHNSKYEIACILSGDWGGKKQYASNQYNFIERLIDNSVLVKSSERVGDGGKIFPLYKIKKRLLWSMIKYDYRIREVLTAAMNSGINMIDFRKIW